MANFEYTAQEALDLLIKKLQSRDERLAAELQAAIDAGKDVLEAEPSSSNRKNTRSYRKTVPFSHEEALQVALDVLQACFVELPLFVDAALDNFDKTAIGTSTNSGSARRPIHEWEQLISIEQIGAKKAIAIELLTETQINRSGEPIIILKRTPKRHIGGQQEQIARIRSLMDFDNRDDELIEEEIERIARDVFEASQREPDNSGRQLNIEARVYWKDLQELIKERKREQLRRTLEVLRSLGLRICAASSGNAPVFFSLRSDQLELLAKCEHKHWMASKFKERWHYGEGHNNLRREHPHLVEWNELPLAAKEHWRQLIRKMLHEFATAGYEIAKPLS